MMPADEKFHVRRDRQRKSFLFRHFWATSKPNDDGSGLAYN
jgi:hypothetical protein